MAGIVNSKATSRDCVLECFKNVIDLPQAYPCTKTLSRVLCSPGKINIVPRWNPVVLTPESLTACAAKASFAELFYCCYIESLGIDSALLGWGEQLWKSD